MHSAALLESGCCCCDYHSEKSLYLLVQLQLHTSLAKKKSRWQHLADLGSHQKNVIFNIGEVQADRKLYFMDMKVLGGYQFSNLFCQKKDQFRNSYLLPKGGKREGILPKRYFLRTNIVNIISRFVVCTLTNIRPVFDRNLKDPSFKNQKFTVEIMY